MFIFFILMQLLNRPNTRANAAAVAARRKPRKSPNPMRSPSPFLIDEECVIKRKYKII